jgi:hypothetical protein
MNPIPAFFRFAGLLAIASGFASMVPAQEPAAEPDKLLRIQVEWIAVESGAMTSLLREKPSSDTALRETLQGWIEDGEAELVDTSLVTARSGQRAKVEAIQEQIYPTDYEAPRLLNPEAEKGSKTVLVLPHAKAFETRNVGATLEVDPVLGADGRTVDLNLAPELVYLSGFDSWGNHEGEGGTVEIRTPEFFTVKTTTQVVAVDGEYCLLSAQSPRNEETGATDGSRKLMAFVRVDVIPVAAKPAP